MATRMQQRRGTAAQWTGANPILAAGEIGFESDTSKFKIGDGVNHWADLIYYASAEELSSLLDGAPDLLNTLNELAAAVGDDPTFFTTVANNLSAHSSDTTSVHGIANTANLATLTNVDDKIATATDALEQYADGGVSNHNTQTTNVHGIADTSALALTTDLTAHTLETTNVHGIADTAALALVTDLTDHTTATTSVHGIANTAELATLTDLSNAIATAATDMSANAGVGIDWNTVSQAFDIDETVATKTYADDAVSTHNSDTTNVHGIADTSQLALLSDVSAVTAATLGLGNVDNTSDADKPVSTATETAIATAKSEAIAEVTAVIDSAPSALNTLNELAAALGDDANFASTVTTALDAKVASYTPIVQKTASYTLSSLSERDSLVEVSSSSATTITIPANSAVAYPVGTSLDILQTSTGQVTIAGADGVTVNATPGLKLRAQWSSATLFKRAENTWVVYGDLTA